MLQVEDLHVHYGGIHALQGVHLEVPDGSIVTLIGANGAGKSTTLRAVTGLVRPRQGRIRLQGREITRLPAHKIVAAGVAMVPEGRRIFPNLTVRENLLMGSYLRRDASGVRRDMDWVFRLFPRLKERQNQRGGTLSGGEQQMLAIGRALMSRPSLLLLDEPSLGLAPLLVREVFQVLKEINAEGRTLLLVEQNAHAALGLAHHAYVLETGRIVLEGSGRQLQQNAAVRRAYLGDPGAEAM
ncbi:MAG: ABC transporter ATP-binding protein [Firmicutes bacterium]|nr:ABC transporter ATP-binding protein [Bacillota bacterium]